MINLFTYWEGIKPAYISLCEEILVSTINTNICYHKITSENVNDYISVDKLPSKFSNITCLAHRADYIRCSLLYLYGGMWLDLDQVIISDLSNINDMTVNYDYITYEWEPFRPSIGFLFSKKQNILLKLWKQQMDQKIESGITLTWESLGYEILWPIIKDLIANSQLKYYAFPAKTSFAPLEWNEQDKFFSDSYTLDYKNLYSVMLYNSQIPQWFKNMTKEEILNSNYFISRLLKANYG